MATGVSGGGDRRRVGRRAALFAGVLALAWTTAARADSRDLYLALKDGDCVAFGNAINQGMEQSDPESFFFAGFLYDNTSCVAEDPAKAARYYRRALALGYADARGPLGLLHGLGRGVSQDYIAAYRWYTAGANGQPGSADVDPESARAGGYAITVAQVARDRVRYPVSAERAGIESSIDVLFEPASGRITFGNARTSIEVGSNIGKSGPFRDAIEAAYAEAVATVRRPDDLARVPLRFGTPWRFGIRRGRNDDVLPLEGTVTLGDTVTLPSTR